MKRTYFGAVEKGRKSFGIVFPDFWGCVSSGDSLEEVIVMGREALQSHIDTCIDYGDDIPKPSSFTLDQVRKQLSTGHFVALVAVEVDIRKPGKTVPVQLDRSIALSLGSLKIDRTKFISKAVRNELARLKKSA
jgi:predicted RNase H-like HicB family nuclease